MTTHRKVYRFRVDPTPAQAEQMYSMAGAKRFVFNWALARRKDHYAEHGEGLSAKVLSAELTALKKQPDSEWLKGVDSQLLQQALRDVDRAFQNFFDKRGRFPRFKSKRREIPSFRIPQRVKVEAGKVYVPKVGWVKARQSQPVDCPTKSATFKRDATRRWYVTLTAEFEMPEVPLQPAEPNNVVGIDLGLRDFAVLSTGERIAPPKHYRQSERRLAKAQRRLSRRQKGSKNRDKARLTVARVHLKIRNQRADFLHKLTTSLVRSRDGLCIEDLSFSGMAKTKLAKSVLDAGLAEFRRQLEYKSVWNGRHLAVIHRWYPSTKLCQKCGTLNTLTLADRVCTCTCGAHYDRDSNAGSEHPN
ncbi:MAG: transposase [Trueperaceae bacterium]